MNNKIEVESATAEQNKGNAPREPGAVVVAMIDGQKLGGRLSQFRAQASHLCLLPDPLDLEQRESRTLATDDIAYVGFLKGSEWLITLPNEQERWRVRAAGGDEWSVYAAAHSTADGIGFVGRPIHDDRFAALYFFRHGVNSRERDAPLGAILLASGLLAHAALEEGVVLQRKNRSIPIGQILVEQQKIDSQTVIEAVDLQRHQNVRIGEVLREAGLLSTHDLDKALAEQKRRKGLRLGEVLVDLDVLTERDLAVTLGLKFAMPFVEPDQLAPAPTALSLVGPELIEKHGVLPLAVDERTLTVALSDPTDVAAIEALRTSTKRRVQPVLTTSSALKRHIHEQLHQLRSTPPREVSSPSRDRPVSEAASASAGDGVGKLLNDIIGDAFRREVSSIHIESNGKQHRVNVRYGVGGRWPVQSVFPPIVRNALVARLKLAAGLDQNERAKPQSGAATWRVGETQVQLRVSTLPNASGDEDVALALRTPARAIGFDHIGWSRENQAQVRRALSWRKGLILCTGLKGAGKTSLLHSLVGELKRPDAKILAAETAIEIVNPVCRQLPVEAGRGAGFAAHARALLEVQPDVLVLGDLPDDETCRVAVEGVLRGQLVLAGITADGVMDALLRLECAGLPRHVLSSVPLCIVGVHTLRAVCARCSVHERASANEYDELAHAYGPERFRQEVARGADVLEIARAQGCEACGQTGYQGRLALQEVMLGEPSRAESPLGAAVCTHSLRQDAIRKLVAGRTDLAQFRTLSAS